MANTVRAREGPIRAQMRRFSAAHGKELTVAGTRWRYYRLGMTGDGVNDAPAVRAAETGTAMGARGTDTARESAALVITDEFASIADGAGQGRGIFANLRKAMCYIVAVHVPIFGMSLIPAFSTGRPVRHAAFFGPGRCALPGRRGQWDCESWRWVRRLSADGEREAALRKGAQMAKIVHFEIPVDDPQRAVAFYHDVLGWEVSRFGEEPYWLVRAGADEEPGANGALVGREELHRSPVLIAGVADIDDVLARVPNCGGEVIQGKLPVPGVGWSAYVRDSEGNTAGFFQPDTNAAAGP